MPALPARASRSEASGGSSWAGDTSVNHDANWHAGAGQSGGGQTLILDAHTASLNLILWHEVASDEQQTTQAHGASNPNL